MKKFLLFFWELLQIFFISLLIIIPIRYFIVQPFFVKGSSMEPNFENGEYLIIDQISYRFREPARGEVIVFRYPQKPSQFYIKRIIGLPGERIVIQGKEMTIYDKADSVGFKLNESEYLSISQEFPTEVDQKLAENEYFVLGDNRLHSFDSRGWGPLGKKYIIGKVLFRAWPLNKAAAFSKPIYHNNLLPQEL